MTMLADCETDAAALRESMAKTLGKDGVLADPAWRTAVEMVPRHRFVPGFYERNENGLTVWEPVTAELHYGR